MAQTLLGGTEPLNSLIALDRKNGPCTAPSAMPEYASLLSLQDFADVVTYLPEQDGSAAAPATSAAKN